MAFEINLERLNLGEMNGADFLTLCESMEKVVEAFSESLPPGTLAKLQRGSQMMRRITPLMPSTMTISELIDVKQVQVWPKAELVKDDGATDAPKG